MDFFSVCHVIEDSSDFLRIHFVEEKDTDWEHKEKEGPKIILAWVEAMK